MQEPIETPPPRPPVPIGGQKPGQKGRYANKQGVDTREKFLRLIERDPGKTKAHYLRVIGKSWSWMEQSKKRHPDFKARLELLMRAADEKGPPPVSDFVTWRAVYCDHEEENPVTLRKQNVGVTYDYMRPFLQALDDPSKRRIMAIWPIRHGKSAIMEQFIAYTLCRNPNATIKIICASDDLAKDRMHNVRTLLTDEVIYPKLNEDYGAWIGKSETNPWQALRLYVRGRHSAQRDPSVQGMGFGGGILGKRADLIILDDVDNPTNGPDQRKSLLRTINTVIRTRLNEGGRLVVIGNRCGVSDVYSVLMERKDWWYESLSGESHLPECGEECAEGCAGSMCPEMYSYVELQELASDLDADEYAMMVLNDPAPEGSMLFPPELLNLGKIGLPPRQVEDGWQTLVSLDPAGSQRAGSLTVATDPEWKIVRVIDVEAKRHARYDGMEEMLYRQILAYKPRFTIIEESGSTFLTDVPAVQRVIANNASTLVRFKTLRNKNDPKMGMKLVATMLRDGKLQFCMGGEGERIMAPLLDDLVNYRPDQKTVRGSHYDLAMALWFACSTVNSRPPTMFGHLPVDPLFQRRPYLRSPNLRLVGGVRG